MIGSKRAVAMLVGLAALAAAIAGCARDVPGVPGDGRGGARGVDPAVGGARPVVGVEFVGSGGDALALESLRGKVVVVAFWASWCTPCKQVVPLAHAVVEERARRGARGLVLLAPAVGDSPEATAEIAAKQGWAFPVVRDPEGRAAAALGAVALPHTVVIDRRGVVVAQFAGFGSELAARLRAAVDAAAAQP